MPHAHRLSDLHLWRGTLTLLGVTVWAAFAALAVGATVYDVGRWLSIW